MLLLTFRAQSKSLWQYLKTLLANSNTGRTGTHLMTCNIFCTFYLIIERAGRQVEDVKLYKSS